MNPLTNIKNLSKLNDNEIKMGHVGTKVSWHNQYRDSAWCFFGGMPFELTEGDIICIFEQYGPIVNLNLIRDKKTGKSKGFGFICYENQLSTDLAVDNFNGTQVIGRTIKVDHAGNYKPPKDHDDADEVTKFLREEGCSAKIIEEKKDLIASALVKQNIKKEENRLDDFRDEKLNLSYKRDQSKKSRRSRSPSKSRSPNRKSKDSNHRDRNRDYDRDRDRDHHYHHKRERSRDRDRNRR